MKLIAIIRFGKDLLSNSFQCVRVNHALSSRLPLISDTPLGSVLGPLHYILFKNDLYDCVDENISAKSFADFLNISYE